MDHGSWINCYVQLPVLPSYTSACSYSVSSESVLCYHKYGRIVIGKLTSRLYRDGRVHHRWQINGSEYIVDYVLYWMKLPEPPVEMCASTRRGSIDTNENSGEPKCKHD